MPVESGVAPARPSAPVMPVAAPGGASFGAPSLGAAQDLRGTLPVLPSPVPGLLGPVRHFMGETQAAAAASVRPEVAAVRPAPAAATSLRARPADALPALPGKPSPGAPTQVFARDRKSAASGLDAGGLLSRERGDEPSSRPFIETSSLEHARPENAAGLGRDFFDQSDETGRAALEDPAAPAGSGDSVATTRLEGGAYAPGARLAVGAGNAFGAGLGLTPGQPFISLDGETLHDAVASAPGSPATGGPGGGAVLYRTASPNGDLAKTAAAASRPGAALPVLGAPRPLAIDLSGSGLIVRVRSALGAALGPAPSSAEPASRFAPGPSTALLERGALLEAFAVAEDYAVRSAAQSRLQADGAPRVPVAFSAPVVASPAAVPLWWALFLLPLFVVAIRGIL